VGGVQNASEGCWGRCVASLGGRGRRCRQSFAVSSRSSNRSSTSIILQHQLRFTCLQKILSLNSRKFSNATHDILPLCSPSWYQRLLHQLRPTTTPLWTPKTATPAFAPGRSYSCQTRRAAKRTPFWPWLLRHSRVHTSKFTLLPSRSSNDVSRDPARYPTFTLWMVSTRFGCWWRKGSQRTMPHTLLRAKTSCPTPGPCHG
jgi:hypothetical protein